MPFLGFLRQAAGRRHPGPSGPRLAASNTPPPQGTLGQSLGRPSKARPGYAWRGSKAGSARRRKRIHARMAEEGVDATTAGHLRRHRPERPRRHLLPRLRSNQARGPPIPRGIRGRTIGRVASRPVRAAGGPQAQPPRRRPAARQGTAAVSSVARHGRQFRRAPAGRIGRSRPQRVNRNLRQARSRRGRNTALGGANRGGRRGAGGAGRAMQLRRRNLQRRRSQRGARSPPAGRRPALRGTASRYGQASRAPARHGRLSGPAARNVSQRTGSHGAGGRR